MLSIDRCLIDRSLRVPTQVNAMYIYMDDIKYYNRSGYIIDLIGFE